MDTKKNEMIEVNEEMLEKTLEIFTSELAIFNKCEFCPCFVNNNCSFLIDGLKCSESIMNKLTESE